MSASRIEAESGAKRGKRTTSPEESYGHASSSAVQEYDPPSDVAIPSFAKPSSDSVRDLGRLFEAVQSARRIAVVCGE